MSTGRTYTKHPIGSEHRAAIGKQFIGDAVVALETVRALIDQLVESGVLDRNAASRIENTTARHFLLRATEAEARAATPESLDPREKRRSK